MRWQLPILFGLLILLVWGTVLAQELPSLGGVAINVEVADPDAAAGDIISITKEGLRRTSAAYDIQIYGVIAATPVLSVAPKTDKTSALVSSGVTDVKVSAQNGTVEIGDYVTSSDKPGVGQKATTSGYVLGKALARYDDTTKEGLVPAEVNIGFVEIGAESRGNLYQTILNILKKPENLNNFLRYFLAFVIGTLTIIGGTFAFVKFVSTGIVAVGRNPLAKRTIIAGMVLSSFVVALLTLAGLGIAVAIIGVDKISQLWR